MTGHWLHVHVDDPDTGRHMTDLPGDPPYYLGVDRRRFLLTLVTGVFTTPLAARAQHAGKVYRIGVLEVVGAASNAANLSAFQQGLRELGYVEGRNLVIEYRSADGRPERLADLAIELVALKVDVIVTR
jgi:ABC-type uncharacterized transport system substrate-binding protein